MRTHCLLCKRNLEPINALYQSHPDVEDCQVRFTDAFGVAIDEPIIQNVLDNDVIDIQTYPFVEDVLKEIFAEFGLDRLGGASTGRGWSSFSLYQRCPYAWYRRHIVKAQPFLRMEITALAIGTLVHVFLAVYYARMMGEYQELAPETLYEKLLTKANPELVNEGWRLFKAYRLYYRDERITPLAIEHDLRDPRTGESCRYDLIAWLDHDTPGFVQGTYAFEHKTSARFDMDTLDGWANDGEVLGEVALWKRLGLDKRFGELKGVIVNIVGKHKEPRFHRTIVAPSTLQLDGHLQDLKRWDGLIQLSMSTNSFPRARSGCIGRYGRCSEWNHCVTNEE